MKNLELSSRTRFLNWMRIIFRNKFAETILYTFTKGKNLSSLEARLPANYYQYPKGSLRKVRRNGFDFVLDISDYMQWVIYFGIEIEPRTTLYNLVKNGDIVFDIGANIGETTLEFSRRAKQVYSFEPDPETLKKLTVHLKLNGCTNVTVFPYAIGAEDKVAFIERNEINSGGNRVTNENSGVAITIKNLDALCKSENIPFPNLIKIDVEGFEGQVLEGSCGLLKQCKPLIFAEMNNALLERNKSSVSTIISFLNELGYCVSRADNGKELIPEMNFSGQHFDIIARPK